MRWGIEGWELSELILRFRLGRVQGWRDGKLAEKSRFVEIFVLLFPALLGYQGRPCSHGGWVDKAQGMDLGWDPHVVIL